MKGFEKAPFCGIYKGMGIHSCDSTVGFLEIDHEEIPRVLKWNKKHIPSERGLLATCTFLRKSIELYRAALGEEFVLPTHIVAGEKFDGSVPKYKIYTIQPFVDGWTAKTLPDEFRDNVMDQWTILNSRLFHMYNVASYVNRNLIDKKSSQVFPIALTVGNSRAKALFGDPGGNIPATPNLLISNDDYKLYICDFGDYIPWHDDMDFAYEKILEMLQTK